MLRKLESRRLLVLIGAAALAAGMAAEPAFAQGEGFNPYPLRPPDMASPRDTLQSFQHNARDAIQLHKTGGPRDAIQRAVAHALRCLDLSELPPALRSEQGLERALLLVEILDRIELPPLDDIPGIETVEATGLTRWTIPNTEITIARTEDGPNAGKFQFSAQTVAQLPSFYEQARHLPYKPDANVGIYEDFIYSPGPWLPRTWVSNLPSFAYMVVLGQTVWQWLGAFVTVALTTAVVILAYLWGRRMDRASRALNARSHAGRAIATILAIMLISLTSRFLDAGINITGTPALVLEVAVQVALAGAVGWLILLILNAIGEAIIRLRGSRSDSVDTHLIRIVARLLAILILVYLALYLADSFGIPAAPLLASLGVGGLAIALAVRPTLENIIGGFILFADKPVRVGEFCLFGDKMGTVEGVGLRSTRLRGIDRTVITVPNAEFAQMQIVNFTRRDRMLMHTTLGLRHETTPDQLRYVLTRLREMFVAHPRVAKDPARARFAGFGECSLNIEVFIYVLSEDYNEFLGIAEDINLRIMAIVSEAGTGFAFPSQTAYLARDKGLDAERADAAEAEVRAWRADGALPFPTLAPERVTALDGSLDFPPEGSTAHRAQESGPVTETTRRRRWGIRRTRQSQSR